MKPIDSLLLQREDLNNQLVRLKLAGDPQAKYIEQAIERADEMFDQLMKASELTQEAPRFEANQK